MEEITDQVIVRAPIERVWAAIQDPVRHAEWHPFVASIEGEHALGSTRKCGVLIGDRLGSTEERCSSYEEARKVMWTIESDSSGFSQMVSDWTAGFSLKPQDSGTTRVTAHSMFTPRRIVARVMMPVIRRKFHRTQRVILDHLKQHAEDVA